jgi:hypothetical protein
MNWFLVAALAIALVVSVLALAREMRLRKALEKLLRIILSRWRAHVIRSQPKDLEPRDPSVGPDEWL